MVSRLEKIARLNRQIANLTGMQYLSKRQEFILYNCKKTLKELLSEEIEFTPKKTNVEIVILCDHCKTEFALREGTSGTYAKCPECGIACKTGIDLSNEIGAPSPFPEGDLRKRTTWGEGVIGDKRQCDITISEHESHWVVSYYRAPNGGRHPRLVWQRRFLNFEKANTSFKDAYLLLRDLSSRD